MSLHFPPPLALLPSPLFFPSSLSTLVSPPLPTFLHFVANAVPFPHLPGTRFSRSFYPTIPFLVVVGPAGRRRLAANTGEKARKREREREKERNRRSEQRKITTVNGATTVQRNASEHEDISQVCLAPLCRYGAPANIYSYDNRYAAAGYLNSDAANPAFRRFAPTPASARGRPLFSRELPRLSYFVSHFLDRFTVSTNFCYLLCNSRCVSLPLLFFVFPPRFFFFLVILNFRRVFFPKILLRGILLYAVCNARKVGIRSRDDRRAG